MKRRRKSRKIKPDQTGTIRAETCRSTLTPKLSEKTLAERKISLFLLSEHIDYEKTVDVWRSVEEIFFCKDKSAVMQVKIKLQNLKKEGLTVYEYTTKMKSIIFCWLQNRRGRLDYELSRRPRARI